MADDARNKPLYMISVAAELTGMHPQTLRVYESKGLVNPQRSGGNTRLYSRADIERLELIIFRETSTIGIRRVNMDRTVLERSFERVQTPWGAVSVKRAVLPDGSERIAPELDDCAALARREGIPLQQVMDAARLASRA